MKLNCPHCNTIFDVEGELSTNEVKCPSCQTIVSMIELLTVSISPKDDFVKGLIEDEEDFEPGDSLSHFRLIRQLGRGGFGTVFEAYDRRLDRHVALKVPRVSQLSERQAHIFVREARAAAQLNVPSIVSVFEVGRAENRIFIVSELIDGVTLCEWAKKEKPDQDMAAELVSHLAKSIHHAHEAGIIHRDLKPSNVLVDQQNLAHITDFGLAKRFNDQDESISRADRVMGTPAYMPPEQAAGQSRLADCRSDVYSLGVMLYELLTNVLPFKITADQDIYENIKQGNFKAPRTHSSKIQLDLEAICLKAMALAPQDRYNNALEFAGDLDRFLERRPVGARPPSLLEQVTYFVGRHRVSVAVTALILLLLLLNLSSFSRSNGNPKVQNPVIPETLMDVEFSVIPIDAKVKLARIDVNLGRVDFSNVFEPVTLAKPGGRKIQLRPGTYLIQSESDQGVHEVYRIVPQSTDERISEGFRMTEWKLKDDDSDCVVIQSVELRNEMEVTSGIYELGPERLALIPSGAFETGNDIAQRVDKKGRYAQRVPRKLVSMPNYLLGQTEVTAENFAKVMGRYPAEMPVIDAQQPNSVATHVSWLEAVEYCERIGARLPTYDEYLFAATNRGATRYPFGDQFDFEEWNIDLIKEPAIDKTDGQPPVFNLYSSVGEWAWDVNLSTDSKPMAQIPDRHLLAMWNGRMLLGIPPGAPETLKNMAGSNPRFGPSEFVDQSLHMVKRQNGFRVCKGLSSRF